jgi:hypothetical protein
MGKQALAAAAIALLAAGCGARQQAPALSRAAFLAEANRICAEATTRSGRLARLRALHAPKGGEELYRHWLAAESEALDAAKALANGSARTDDPLVQLVIAEGKAAGYARRIGAQRCARRGTGTMPP